MVIGSDNLKVEVKFCLNNQMEDKFLQQWFVGLNASVSVLQNLDSAPDLSIVGASWVRCDGRVGFPFFHFFFLSGLPKLEERLLKRRKHHRTSISKPCERILFFCVCSRAMWCKGSWFTSSCEGKERNLGDRKNSPNRMKMSTDDDFCLWKQSRVSTMRVGEGWNWNKEL